MMKETWETPRIAVEKFALKCHRQLLPDGDTSVRNTRSITLCC